MKYFAIGIIIVCMIVAALPNTKNGHTTVVLSSSLKDTLTNVEKIRKAKRDSIIADSIAIEAKEDTIIDGAKKVCTKQLFETLKVSINGNIEDIKGEDDGGNNYTVYGKAFDRLQDKSIILFSCSLEYDSIDTHNHLPWFSIKNLTTKPE